MHVSIKDKPCSFIYQNTVKVVQFSMVPQNESENSWLHASLLATNKVEIYVREHQLPETGIFSPEHRVRLAAIITLPPPLAKLMPKPFPELGLRKPDKRTVSSTTRWGNIRDKLKQRWGNLESLPAERAEAAVRAALADLTLKLYLPAKNEKWQKSTPRQQAAKVLAEMLHVTRFLARLYSVTRTWIP